MSSLYWGITLAIKMSKIDALSGASRPAINRILKAVRCRIAELCVSESPFEAGEIKISGSYFNARRVLGIRGRGAQSKHIVLGFIKRGNKVYTQVVRNCFTAELLPITWKKVNEYLVVYGWFLKHMTVWWSSDIKSTIESSIIPTNSHSPPIISCEFRFNYPKKLYLILLKIVRNDPLILS